MLSETWTIPTLQSVTQISQYIKESPYTDSPLGCDISPVNLFLYRNKYKTQLCMYNNCLLRRFNEKGFIYYGFPFLLKAEPAPELILKSAFDFIKKDAAALRIKPYVFFGTKEQQESLKNLQDCFSIIESLNVPDGGIQSVKDRDLADYVYLQKNLSELPGSKYSKKRGHINQFVKKHQDIHYVPLTAENLKLAGLVEDKWLLELEQITGQTASEDLLQEKTIINEALQNFEALKLSGGIVICGQEPAAMCISSSIGNATTDVHFEKALEPYAHDGAYAFINREFAKSCSTCFINREEDLGLENLRKAKLSYYPDTLLEKAIIRLSD